MITDDKKIKVLTFQVGEYTTHVAADHIGAMVHNCDDNTWFIQLKGDHDHEGWNLDGDTGLGLFREWVSV